MVVLAVTASRSWALGILIGQWAHVLTDFADTAGVMPFFPFSTEPVTISMWKHAAAQGRYGDAAAYYSSLGGVWDFFWLAIAAVLRPADAAAATTSARHRAGRPAGVGLAAPQAPAPRERPAAALPGLLLLRARPDDDLVPLRPLRADRRSSRLGRADFSLATTSPTPAASRSLVRTAIGGVLFALSSSCSVFGSSSSDA